MSAALILAGGGSTRMGRDKAWLELDGRPLLTRVIAVVAERCELVVVSAAPGQRLPGAPAGVEDRVLRVDDPVAGAGPLVGIAEGLAAIVARRGEDESVYLGSCDAATLDAEHLRFMFAAIVEAADEASWAVVPVDDEGRRHPLAAVVRAGPALARARAMLAADRQRLQRFLAGPGVEAMPAARLPEPAVLEPCNDPEQWARLLDRLKARAG